MQQSKNGFWIKVWEDFAQTKLVGYLYTCTNCNSVWYWKDKVGVQCPKCGADVGPKPE